MYKKLKIIMWILLIIFIIKLLLNSYEATAYNKKNIQNDLIYYKDYFSNNDIVGSLRIKGTSINTLLVKTTNNQFYLNHSINKEYDEKGSIFVDYRTELNSNQINIYGHNSKKYNLQFKDLEKYKDKLFYEKNKIIELWNGEKIEKYEIFSIKIVTNNEHMNIKQTNIDKHIEFLNNSIYDTNIKATTSDKILLLQTCNYEPKNSYLLIISKKI